MSLDLTTVHKGKVAVFWGCRVLTSQYGYEMSIRETFPRLGIELVDLPEAMCCGDPVKSINGRAANYLAIRSLALANVVGSDDLLVPCNRCHFTLSEAKASLEKNVEFRTKTLNLLKEEGLEYRSETRIWHVIDMLHDCLGIESIRKAATKPLVNLKLAVHYGCQILRYADLGRVDDAENPIKLENLIAALGAETIDYQRRLDCCGAALMLSHPESALSLTGTKLKALKELSIDGLVTCCPDCQMMYDQKQKDSATTIGTKLELPVLYYPQLLGLAMSIEPRQLGLNLNQSPVEKLLSRDLS